MSYSGEGVLMFVQDLSGKAVPMASGSVSAAGTASLAVSNPFNAGSDTFTAPGNGVTQSAFSGVKSFSIQVKGTGAAANAWNVVVEGSLDNVNFTPILVHNTATGDGVLLATTTSLTPCLFFRSRCRTLTLGPATAIVVSILGMD